jgi:hypothetical protein
MAIGCGLGGCALAHPNNNETVISAAVILMEKLLCKLAYLSKSPLAPFTSEG